MFYRQLSTTHCVVLLKSFPLLKEPCLLLFGQGQVSVILFRITTPRLLKRRKKRKLPPSVLIQSTDNRRFTGLLRSITSGESVDTYEVVNYTYDTTVSICVQNQWQCSGAHETAHRVSTSSLTSTIVDSAFIKICNKQHGVVQWLQMQSPNGY